MKKYNNPNLAADLKKMKVLNIPIKAKSLFIPRLKDQFGIDVSESAYFYPSEFERNEDLLKIMRKYTVEDPV